MAGVLLATAVALPIERWAANDGVPIQANLRRDQVAFGFGDLGYASEFAKLNDAFVHGGSS